MKYSPYINTFSTAYQYANYLEGNVGYPNISYIEATGVVNIVKSAAPVADFTSLTISYLEDKESGVDWGNCEINKNDPSSQTCDIISWNKNEVTYNSLDDDMVVIDNNGNTVTGFSYVVGGNWRIEDIDVTVHDDETGEEIGTEYDRTGLCSIFNWGDDATPYTGYITVSKVNSLGETITSAPYYAYWTVTDITSDEPEPEPDPEEPEEE